MRLETFPAHHPSTAATCVALPTLISRTKVAAMRGVDPPRVAREDALPLRRREAAQETGQRLEPAPVAACLLEDRPVAAVEQPVWPECLERVLNIGFQVAGCPGRTVGLGRKPG